MKKRLAFLSLGLVAGLAGVATASAYIFNAPASTSIQGGLDQGVVLDWGTSAKLQGTKTLVYGAAQVETVTLAEPVKSATIAGYAKLTFSLGKPARSRKSGSLPSTSPPPMVYWASRLPSSSSSEGLSSSNS